MSLDLLITEQLDSNHDLAIAYSPDSLVEFFNALLIVIQNVELIISQSKQVEEGLQNFTLGPSVAATHDAHPELLRSANLLKSIFHIYRSYTSFGAVNKVNVEDGTLFFSRSDFLETTKNGTFIWASQPFSTHESEEENDALVLDAIIGANECYNVVAFMGSIISTVLKGRF